MDFSVSDPNNWVQYSTCNNGAGITGFGIELRFALSINTVFKITKIGVFYECTNVSVTVDNFSSPIITFDILAGTAVDVVFPSFTIYPVGCGYTMSATVHLTSNNVD